MLYAIISDIHANLEALNAVLEDINSFNVDSIYSLGDIIGYGPNPNECVELIIKNNIKSIKGNHERALSNKKYLENFNLIAANVINWTEKELTVENKEILEGLTNYIILEEKFILVHGSLKNLDKYLVENEDIIEEVEELKESGFKIEFFGHTHISRVIVDEKKPIKPKGNEKIKLNPDNIYLINPGSVGQPREADNRASYIIFDSDNLTVTYRKVNYDIEKTIKKIKSIGLPEFLANRLKFGI
ncbi:MAG TPA: metallophosphoesterase family protein [Spirochaetota bacterium]|nr:metallophosphoesterase family protein [Spirochaetota bacterium]HOM39095.1 metallophosphoesterase family protein [Spirochaetota bacterium]HPQ49588.1 metallophosphoesterase family protein [Spirochaetota bacterium]